MSTPRAIRSLERPAPELLRIRPMQKGDVAAVADLAAAAFAKQITDELAAQRWRERVAYPLRTDPAGAFVAELDGCVVGVAEAIARERLWCLSLFAVQPGRQSAGAAERPVRVAVSRSRSVRPVPFLARSH